MALLVNLINPMVKTVLEDSQAAAVTFGLKLNIVTAGNEQEFAAIFAHLVRDKTEALVIGIDNFFTNRSKDLAELTVQNRVPAIYQYTEFTTAGGLMSFGGSSTDSWRLAGVYAGRILKGEKPAELPIQQVTKVELIINLKSAKALKLTLPQSLIARADEVIE
jgi:putative ABC transport system substrate-binding protein